MGVRVTIYIYIYTYTYIYIHTYVYIYRERGGNRTELRGSNTSGGVSGVGALHVEYAECRIKYGILFICIPFYEYSHLEYE